MARTPLRKKNSRTARGKPRTSVRRRKSNLSPQEQDRRAKQSAYDKLQSKAPRQTRQRRPRMTNQAQNTVPAPRHQVGVQGPLRVRKPLAVRRRLSPGLLASLGLGHSHVGKPTRLEVRHFTGRFYLAPSGGLNLTENVTAGVTGVDYHVDKPNPILVFKPNRNVCSTYLLYRPYLIHNSGPPSQANFHDCNVVGCTKSSRSVAGCVQN